MKRKLLIVLVVVVVLIVAFVFGRRVWYKNIRQCPESINCMPGPCMDFIDGKMVEIPYGSKAYEAKGCGECKIPLGCQGYTEVLS